MKQNFFKIDSSTLKILHIESVRAGFYLIAIVLFSIFIIMLLMAIIFEIIDGKPLFAYAHFIFGNFILVFLEIILPLIIVIFANRFPAAPIVWFNRLAQAVSWQVGEKKIEIPYAKIAFEKKLFMLKNGMSSCSVLVRAISKTPFSDADKPLEHEDQMYIKDLCMYNAGSGADADESIEIIKMFMSEKWEAYSAPSRFDDI